MSFHSYNMRDTLNWKHFTRKRMKYIISNYVTFAIKTCPCIVTLASNFRTVWSHVRVHQIFVCARRSTRKPRMWRRYRATNPFDHHNTNFTRNVISSLVMSYEIKTFSINIREEAGIRAVEKGRASKEQLPPVKSVLSRNITEVVYITVRKQ